MRLWPFRRRERELDEEIEVHLRMAVQDRIESGEPADEARRAAEREFGNQALVKEVTREMWGWTAMEAFAQDFRYAARVLRKTPGFTFVALLTLAVGLGLNTAVFSVVNAVMLRDLPYREPGRLVALWEEHVREGPALMSTSGPSPGPAAASRYSRGVENSGAAHRITVAPANLVDYQARSTSFTGLAGVGFAAMNLTGAGTPERVWGQSVTTNFFTVLGVGPARGRDFTAEDARSEVPEVVIISDEFGQRRFGAGGDVLGRTLMLDQRPYRIIGVLPRGFQAPDQFGMPERIEFYIPAVYPKELLANHADHEIRVVGRLKTSVSIESAQAELDSITAGLQRQYPDSNRGVRAVIAPLRGDIVRNVRVSLLVLLGAVGLIVLTTCVNVANLLLVRGVARRHETSVRLSLGASRMRIIRQYLAEGMLVAACGCIAGVLLGSLLARVLVLIAPANIPRLDQVQMDWRVFAASAGLALLTGVAFGIAPAWQASRAKPVESLKATEHSAGGVFEMRWRAALTVTEIAMSLVLLIGAGLLLKSFVTVLGVDLGFQPDRVLAMNINLPETRYGTALQRYQFFDELEARARNLPGVQSVAFANRMPMRGGWGGGLQVDTNPTRMRDCDFQAVSPGYFETLGITLLRGRLLSTEDREGEPYAAVVNHTFVRQFLENGDALGRRIRRHDKAPWITIVGVVSDIRRDGKTADIRPQVYLSAAHTTLYPVRLSDFAVRTAGDPKQLVKELQRQVWAIDKDQPVTGIRTMEEIISTSVAQRRFQALLLLSFAGVAVVLAVIGIFGVLSYSVTQRTSEFGIRVALGAAPANILGLVLRQAALLISAGIAIGMTGAYALTRYVEDLLFGVQAHDWRTYCAAAVLLAAVSFIASAIPARRGGLVDPMAALRCE